MECAPIVVKSQQQDYPCDYALDALMSCFIYRWVVVQKEKNGGIIMSLEAEINLYCPQCKKHHTEQLDPTQALICAQCGGVLHCTGFQVLDM
jgi:hypothetical protein